jgi:hypothetical protein
MENDAQLKAQEIQSDNVRFYDYIVQLSKSTPSGYKELLEKDSVCLVELITKGYKENIKISAMRGKNISYICIYRKDSKYDKTFPIHDYIDMPDKIKSKFEEHNIITVPERLKKIVHPFVLNIRHISECYELHELDFYKNMKSIPDIFVVSVSWNS